MSRFREVAALVTFCTVLGPWARAGEKPLNELGLNEADLALPAGWDLPHTIPAIEGFFKAPLTVPAVSKTWLDGIESSTESAALFRVPYQVLSGVDFPSFSAPPSAKNIASVIALFKSALNQAQPLVNTAVNSVAAEDRRAFLQEMDWPDESTGLITQDISAQRVKRKFERMESFKQTEMLKAAALLMQAADQTIAALANVQTASLPSMKRVKTPNGVFLIGGPGDNTYTEKDLKDVVVLIDLGGKNIYEAPVAAARDGQIRMVLDFGTDITVSLGDKPGAVASGLFGIGLFYAPNASGKKTITSGAFSQGCGVGGVGGLFLAGESHLRGDLMVQGAGSFGVGLLDVKEGRGSTYLANRNGQGAGFARGVGLFRHDGDEADIRGGLVQPDPREPQGAVSVCQGVGFGRRAYTGGGLGIATVRGDRVHVQGSYFAQGCGYWHAHGIFHLRGNHGTLQARRYSLGSGVHSAFGHLEIDGNENRVLNWGVGPAYGWDRGLGSARVHGDKNEIQADWGTGTAAIGGLSFSALSGNDNRLKLPGYGSGGFFNDETAYAFHTIDGQNNLLEAGVDFSTDTFTVMNNPWGAARMNGVRAVKNLHLEKPVWPDLPQEPARARERVDLQGTMNAAQDKPLTPKTADLLDVASAFTVDPQTPRQALENLLSLPDDAAKSLVEILEPAATDQLIRLRLVLSAFGEQSVAAILAAYNRAPLQKQSVFIAFLGRLAPDKSYPFLFDQAFRRPNDNRLRLNAIRSLGALLNYDTGQEPGTGAIYEELGAYLKNVDGEKRKATDLLSRLRPAEAFGILSAVVPLDGAGRVSFLKAGPKDITETIGPNGAAEMLRLVLESKTVSGGKINGALAQMAEREQALRRELYAVLSSTSASEAALAATVLGQIGKAEDASRVVLLVTHPKAAVRRAAATALARMGDDGLKRLEIVFTSASETRGTILAALPNAVSPYAENLLFLGIQDENPLVRLQSLSVFGSLPPVLEEKRKGMAARAKKLLRRETDPSVKLATLLLN